MAFELADYDFFLFDFDGLLVDTEYLHYKAYKKTLVEFEIGPFWPYKLYCRYAHLGLHHTQIYEDFPLLKKYEPDWESLRKLKRVHYQRLLEEGSVSLMPGAAELLEKLQAMGKSCCVVTNSVREDVERIRKKNAALGQIAHWLTRDDYDEPKPSPMGYLMALERFAPKGGRFIGFEDTVKGLQALHLAEIEPVLVCPNDHPQLSAPISFPFKLLGSLGEI